MNDFVFSRVCFYSSMFVGESNMRHIIEYAHEKGVFGVELMSFCDELRTPDMDAAKELGRLARGYGLALPCFSAAVHLAGAKREDGYKRLIAYAEICSELEIPYLHHTIFPPLSSEACPEGRIPELFSEGLEGALRIHSYAERLGVQTIVENQGLVFNGCERYNRLLSEAEGKILPLLDVGNILFADETPEMLLEGLSLPVAHVHLKDYKRVTDPALPADYETRGGSRFSDIEIGVGDLNLRRVAELLRKQNYRGAYALEFCKVKEPSEVDRVLARITEIFGDC